MYSVPIIPPDLRHEETIIQAAIALDYLQNTIADVFDRIDARIAKNQKKVEEIQNRIDVTSKNIHKLIGINKAIKIFSPAKFPASHILQDIPQTFQLNNETGSPSFELKTDYQVVSSQEPIQQRNIQDKLLFYHVRSGMNSRKSHLHKVLEQKLGLGRVATSTKSISGILLYNTAENVYDRRKQTDNLHRVANSKRGNKLRNDQTSKIDAPPKSMINRNQSDKKPNQGLFYTPKLNEAPEIDVPIDLPDLPGIVDDIIFNETENERIAPSLYIENLPDLPEPQAMKDDNDSTNQTSQQQPSIPSKNDTNLPPPPPPPSEVISHQSVIITKTPTLPPPPPPPPPQIQPPPPPPPTATASSAPLKAQIPDATDARMNLMEAIRKAGGTRGAKLKQAAAAEVAKSNEAEEKTKTTKSGGDLMADLHNKLLMRRKGISGAKENESGTGNVLDKLSALIPPPPKPQPSNSSTTDASEDDEDWAD